MPSTFSFSPSPAQLIVELTANPRNFAALLEALYTARWDGQLLLDFRRGRPKSAAFPQLVRVPLTQDP